MEKEKEREIALAGMMAGAVLATYEIFGEISLGMLLLAAAVGVILHMHLPEPRRKFAEQP